jgi:hypothetical protein
MFRDDRPQDDVGYDRMTCIEPFIFYNSNLVEAICPAPALKDITFNTGAKLLL